MLIVGPNGVGRGLSLLQMAAFGERPSFVRRVHLRPREVAQSSNEVAMSSGSRNDASR